MRKTVLRETACLGFVCLADLVATILLIESGKYREANPLLSWALEHGYLEFSLLKLCTFLPALVILEKLRPEHEEFVREALGFCLWCYLGIWCVGFLYYSPLFVGF